MTAPQGFVCGAVILQINTTSIACSHGFLTIFRSYFFLVLMQKSIKAINKTDNRVNSV